MDHPVEMEGNIDNNGEETASADKNNKEGTFDTIAIKIENLQQVRDDASDTKRQRTEGDNSTAYKTVDLISDEGDKTNTQMPTIEEQSLEVNSGPEQEESTEEEDFIPVGARGKVHWPFVITTDTTDTEIRGQGPGRLTHAVIQVEKKLQVKIQDAASPMGPQDLARRARDLLVHQMKKPAESRRKDPSYLIPNPVFEIDTTTQQTPGVRVTAEEQSLADAGVLEYTFQVELNLKQQPELTAFQHFASRMVAGDPEVQFLPWFANADEDLPVIDKRNSPFQTVRGEIKLKNYLGPYNKTRSRLYGRVKVRTRKDFEATKRHLVEWLRKDLHWIKADYIQARRISNIGILLGTYSVVDMAGTRTALENAVKKEIGRDIRLDLRLRRFKCKNRAGRNTTTTAFSVSVDSRQVSEATKGLRAILNRNCVPPTGRRIGFVTKATNDPRILQKNEELIAKHHEEVANDRKLYRKLGVPLTAAVTLKNGKTLSLQQTLCALSATRGGSLFTGVERMGKTETSLFTTHKSNMAEAKRTLQSLPQVMQRVLTLESYKALDMGNPPQHEPEYEAMIKQENEYLDGLLNLEHCTEIDIAKKRKKDDETVGAQTAISGLTNVSPQTQTTAGTSVWTNLSKGGDKQDTPMNMDIDDDEPVTQVTSTLTSTHPDVARLEQESKQQQQTISNMGKEIEHLRKSVQELVQYKSQEEESKTRFGEWQQKLNAQMNLVEGTANETKKGQATMQQDMSSLKGDLRKIMLLLQGGALPASRSANLNETSGNRGKRTTHDPDPPTEGSGRI